MRVYEITTSGEFEALSEEWSALWERCPSATPFQSPEWALAWWRRLGRGRLRILAARDAGRLVGLAPLFARGFGPLRRIRLLGTGNTDYLDFLTDPAAPEAGHALFAHLAGHRSGWELCDLQQLAPGAAVWGCGSRDAAGLVLDQELCPRLPLPATVEAWREGLGSKLRSNLRYCARRLERLGASIDRVSAETLDEGLEALFRLHGARWRRRGLPGVFTSARVRAFHQETAAAFLRRGWLRIYALRLDGGIRAALYCFAARGRTFYYAGGFDPELRRLSPGTVLTGHAIEQSILEGSAEFDFLRGNEPYKYAWGAVDRVSRRLAIGPPPALRLVRAEQNVEQWAKGLARHVPRAGQRLTGLFGGK